MQFWLDEYDAVEELLDDLVFALAVLLRDLLPFHFGLAVDGGLRGLSISSVLQIKRAEYKGCVRERASLVSGELNEDVRIGRTDASNALNSISFAFRYSSISFVACVRASLSFWTLSAHDKSKVAP